MNHAWVLSKTEKGREEIATRAEHLPAPARTALILVDGNATIDELLRRNSAFTSLELELRGLLDAGFVTVYGKRSALSGARDRSPGFFARVRGRIRERPGRLLGELVGMANESIGPEAVLVTRSLQAARSREELRAAIERAAIAVEGYVGPARATQFRLRGDVLLRHRFPDNHDR